MGLRGVFFLRIKKPFQGLPWKGYQKAGNDLLSRSGSIIGMIVLTTEFGMGSGGTLSLWSPAKQAPELSLWNLLCFVYVGISRFKRPNIGACLNRSVVGTIKQSTVSTGHLKASQPLQLLPINLVVYKGSLTQKCVQILSRGRLPA